jgi:hypothetical protein
LAVIEWTEDGEPVIAFGATDRSYAVPPSTKFEIRKVAAGKYRVPLKGGFERCNSCRRCGCAARRSTPGSVPG